MAKKKMNTFQNWGTLFALLISVLALVVSVYETNLMAIQQRATVWPYLYIGKNYKRDNFQLELSNNGTGPAVVKSVEVSVGGKAVKSYFEMFDVIKPDHQIDYEKLSITRLSQQVVRANDTRVLLQIDWNEEVEEMVEEIAEIDIKVTYCSVLDECWIYDFKTNTRTEGTRKARIEFEN